MNGYDQTTTEILRAIGSLEGTISTLVDQSSDNQKDIKAVCLTCQRFEEYRTARKDLPDRIAKLEAIATDYERSKAVRDEKYKQIDFLLGKWQLAWIAAAILTVLANILSFMFIRGWLRLDL